MKKPMFFFLCLLIFLLGTTLAQERKLQVKKWITITSPKAGDEFKTSDSIKVSWNSVGITGMLKASLHKYQQAEVQTYGGNLQSTGSLTVQPGRIKPGRYFIRFEEIEGNAKTDSGVFSVLLPIGKPNLEKKQPQTLEVTIPAQIRDRHSRRTQRDSGSSFIGAEHVPNEPQHSSIPSRARVGFANYFWKDGSVWKYTGFIYRSRLFFDISQFVGKKGILIEAKLILKHHSADSNYPDANFCGQDLHVLTGAWEQPVKCIDTPGYHYKRIHANDTQSIDIAQQMTSWISGAEVNHGLLFTGIIEQFRHDNVRCVSYYSAELYIKFREY